MYVPFTDEEIFSVDLSTLTYTQLSDLADTCLIRYRELYANLSAVRLMRKSFYARRCDVRRAMVDIINNPAPYESNNNK